MADNSAGAINFEAWIKTSDFEAQLKNMQTKIKDFGTNVTTEGKNVDNTFANIAKSAAAMFTFDAALNFRSKLIEVRGEFQKFEAVLTNSLGSQKEAATSMKMLSDIASSTPFQLDALTGSYVKLVNQGFKPTRDEITKLGDLASSTGKGFDQLAEALLDAQTGEFERLKEFGIKGKVSGDLVSLSFKGVTTTVQNSSEAIRNYMLSLGDMQGVKGSMEAISGTLVGQVSNLEDSITAMFNNIGQSSEGFLSGSISATKLLVDNYAAIGKAIGVLVSMYGGYKAAVITTTIVERAREAALLQTALAGRAVSTWQAFHIGIVQKATAAQALLNNTMLANPFVLAGAAIAGVITYLVLFKEKTDSITKAQKEFRETSEKTTAEVTALFDQLKRTNAGTEERKKILEQLNGKYPEYLTNMNLEVASLADIEKAQKAVSNAMLEKMAVEGRTKDLTDVTERKLATLKTIQAKSTKTEYAEILAYIEKGAQAATYSFDQATGKLKSNTVFVSWGKDIDNLLLSLDAIKQQEKAVNDTWDGLLSTMQQPIKATVKASKTDPITGQKEGSSDLSQSQKDETARYNARITFNKIALDKMAANEALFQQNIIAMGNAANEANIGNSDKRVQAMADVLLETQTLQERIFAIEAEYQEKRNALLSSNPENKAAKLATLEANKQDAINIAKDEAYQKTEVYRKLSEDIVNYGRKQLLERIAQIKEELAVANISAEMRLELERKLGEAKTKIGTDIADGFKGAANILGEMSGLVGIFDEKLGKTVGTAADLANGVGNAIGSFATGNIIGGITASIGVIKNIIGLFHKDNEDTAKKAAEQEAARTAAIETTSRAIADMNRLLEDQLGIIDSLYGTNKLEAYRAAFAKLPQDIKDTTAAMDRLNLSRQVYSEIMTVDPETGKEYVERTVTNVSTSLKTYLEQSAGNLSEAISKMRTDIANGSIQGGEAAINQAKEYLDMLEQDVERAAELQAKYNEYITGSTASSLINEIASAFESGKTSAADFADTFESMMKKAVLESLKIKYLEAPLSKFYEDFAAMSGDAGGLTAAEIEVLRAQYSLIMENASASWAQMQELLNGISGGSSTLPGSTSALTGAIKGVTEETASLLGGQINAMRINQAQQLDATRESLLYLANIENNTYNLHSMRRTLEKMNGKMSNSGSSQSSQNSIL